MTEGRIIELKPLPKQYEAWQHLSPDNKTTKYLLFGGGAGGGKVVKYGSEILTPFGFVKEFKVGDLISNPDGSVQRIIQVKPDVTLEKWTVNFSDGTSTEVAEDHLWLAWKGRKTRKIKNVNVGGHDSAEVVETKELKNWLDRGYSPQIPVCEPQPFNVTTRENKPLDPYLLGLLLGDETITTEKSLRITSHEDDVGHYIKAINGHWVRQNKGLRPSKNDRKDIWVKLKKYGLAGTYSHTKFIPRQYKFGSLNTRFAIVRGLMDTDGYSPKGKHACYYTTVSKALAEDMTFILRSLGAVVTITTKTGQYRNNDGDIVRCKLVYNLYIKSRNPDMFFSLPRKIHGRQEQKISKSVVSVEIGGTVTGRCITVSNPNGLYITDNFVVTHNSWLGCEWLIYMSLVYPNLKSFIGRMELKRLMGSTFETFRKVCAFHHIEDGEWKLNSQYNHITFRNGSKIDLIDVAPKPTDPLYERFGSLEYTIGFGEEVGEWPFRPFDVLKSRIGRHMNKEYSIPPKFLLTANPKKNWLKRTIWTPYQNGTLDSKYQFVRSMYSDNHYTSKEYGDNLNEITDPVLRQRLRDGDWNYDDDSDALCSSGAIQDIFHNVLEHNPDRYATLDVARFGKDTTKLYLWQGWNVYDIVTWKGQDTAITAEKVKVRLRKEGIPLQRLVIDEVGVGGGVLDALRGARGFIANASPMENPNAKQQVIMRNGELREVTPRENFVSLKDQCGFHLAELINSHAVGIDCTDEALKEQIESELGQLRDDRPDGDGKKRLVPKEDIKEAIGRSPDNLDCMLMRAVFDFLPPTNDSTYADETRVRENRARTSENFRP